MRRLTPPRRSPILGAAVATLLATFAALTATGAPDDIDRTLDLPVDKPVRTPGARQQPPPPGAPAQKEDDQPRFYGTEIHSDNQTVFFVIDISGSMAYDIQTYIDQDGNVQKGSRLDRAKAELTRCITQLPERFKLNVLAYDCSSTQWRDIMQPASSVNKKSAIQWVQALQPGGGTGTGYAVALALKAKDNRLVVLLTDGAPNCYLGGLCGSDPDLDSHLNVIREANTQNAVVDVFGVGATGQFKQFCVDVASQNGGSYTDVR
jgi:Mg-chelatase subunit ChlD